MATHEVDCGTITIMTDHDSGHVVLTVRDELGREVEIRLSDMDADIIGFKIMDAGGEL